MERTILIATHNKDKFNTVRRMLENVSNNKFTFINLNDLEINRDVEEIGNIIERAEQKARLVIDLVKDKVEAVIGIDDGIKIKGTITTETKKEADKILAGDYLELGELAPIIRGYFIINTKTKNTESCLTEIPFKYVGNENKIKREEGKYPLSYVLARIDSSKPIGYDTEEDNIKYTLSHSIEGLKKLFQVF